MKKTTKPIKAPAPASKPVASAPALKSTIAPKIKKPATASPAPSIVVKPKASKVTIAATADIGFGNTLFLRGDGAGLSWSSGKPLDCIDGTWTLTLSGIEKPFEFKLLVNDQGWSTGPNYSAGPGDTVTVTPVF